MDKVNETRMAVKTIKLSIYCTVLTSLTIV